MVEKGDLVRGKRGTWIDRRLLFEVIKVVPERISKLGKEVPEAVECYEIEVLRARGAVRARFRTFRLDEVERVKS